MSRKGKDSEGRGGDEYAFDAADSIWKDARASLESLENGGRTAGAFDSETLASGAMFGPYRIESLLGSGGMGRVYRAVDTRCVRTVALKVVKPSGLDATVAKRMAREGKIMARMTHPNIVRIFETGLDPQIYLAMELVVGFPLTELIRQGKAGFGAAAVTVGKVALAVHSMHREGILHRDIKPSNIMVTPQWEPKLMDFGLSKVQGADGTQMLTMAGEFVGTMFYMAPEQFNGKASAASDVYSLGATLYEILTGRPPVTAQNWIEVAAQIVQKAPVPPRRWNRDVPESLEAICLKCLAKTPGDRYVSALLLAQDLRSAMAGRPILAGATEPQVRTEASRRAPVGDACAAPERRDSPTGCGPESVSLPQPLDLEPSGASKLPEEVGAEWIDGGKSPGRTRRTPRHHGRGGGPAAEGRGTRSRLAAWAAVALAAVVLFGFALALWMREPDPAVPQPPHAGVGEEPADARAESADARVEPADSFWEVASISENPPQSAESAPVSTAGDWVADFVRESGLGEAQWRGLVFEHDGRPILDMSSEAWASLGQERQEALASLYQMCYAASVGRPVEKEFAAGGTVFAMRFVPPGRFWMGSNDPDVEDVKKIWRDRGWGEYSATRHRMVVGCWFWLQKTEISQGQWRAVAGDRPWSGKEYTEENDRHAAAHISHDDIASKFLPKLGSGWKLPTEAQWEYACRAGALGRFPWGDSVPDMGKHANVADLTAKESGRVSTSGWTPVPTRDNHALMAPVGSLSPNAFGMHDMIGNVLEWCFDWCGNYAGDAVDPSGPSSSSGRVFRGGAWVNFEPWRLHSAYRGGVAASNRWFFLGGRVSFFEAP